MKASERISEKIFTKDQLKHRVLQWRVLGKTVAFTNGCFDILHKGHIHSLVHAAKEADYLIVGLNSDMSVRHLKGPGRPINNESARAEILASLVMVDAVIIFHDETPRDIIIFLEPDVLVKGGDYSAEQIAGAKEVLASGGRVVINPLLEGYSTTHILSKLKSTGAKQ